MDDDEDMVVLVRRLLKKEGIQCELAGTVEEALKKERQLEESPLLLLDHMLPDGTGLDVLKGVLDHRPDTPAVVMSSGEDAKSVVEYMKAGAKDFLFKGDGFMQMLVHVTNRTLDAEQRIRRLKEAESSMLLNSGLLMRSEKMARMGSWRRDLRQDITTWSENMYGTLGLLRDEVEGHERDLWFFERVHEEDRKLLLDARAETMQLGQTTTVEFRFKVGDGEKILRAVHDTDNDTDGRPLFLYGTLQDITEEKQSQLELLKLSQAVEQSSAAISITDMQGTIDYVNSRFSDVSGYSKEELVGANHRKLKSGEHDDIFYRKLWDRLLSGKEWQGEFCNRTKSGDLIWESASISIIRDEEGKPLHYLSVKEDITEKKKFQKAMLKLNKALISANKETEKLSADFELFVPRQFTHRMKEEGPGVIRAGFAQEEELTMLFADIRAFTPLSERLGSEGTFEFLNDYLKRVEPCIKDNRGFVDKFVGDGIIALFDGESSPANGVAAAIAMQQAVAEFNEEHVDMEDISVGIGLHCGRVIIGALGSESRLDSTVIGDSVNLAARVEELTKRFKAQILITDSVMKNIERDRYDVRDVMSLKVRGKQDATQIYEVFDVNDAKERELKRSTSRELQKAIALYGEHDFAKAYDIFESLIARFPDDVLCTDYAIRCRYLRKFPSSELSDLGVLEDMNHYLNHIAQRRDPRLAVDLMGLVQWGEKEFREEEVKLSNLSLRGIKMDGCTLPLHIGSIIKLKIRSYEKDHRFLNEDIDVVCQVVWSSGGETPSHGLQFVWMSKDHENAVIFLLERVKDSESKPLHGQGVSTL